jgi:hypothetical protein
VGVQRTTQYQRAGRLCDGRLCDGRQHMDQVPSVPARRVAEPGQFGVRIAPCGDGRGAVGEDVLDASHLRIIVTCNDLQ